MQSRKQTSSGVWTITDQCLPLTVRTYTLSLPGLFLNLTMRCGLVGSIHTLDSNCAAM